MLACLIVCRSRPRHPAAICNISVAEPVKIVPARTTLPSVAADIFGDRPVFRRHGPRNCHPTTMSPWFDVSGGRLRFRRTTNDPVRAWLDSSEGTQVVQAAARQARFSLFGRARVARRQLKRTLSDAIAAPSTREALVAECEHFLAVWSQLAHAPALPRLTLEGRRLVVVPRTMIASRAAGGAARRLAAALESSVPDGFKSFVTDWTLRAMDDAIRRADPQPKRPLHAPESWSCVHVDQDFQWVVSFEAGDPWRGHVLMFELPPGGLGRRQRQALGAAIAELTSSIPNLTRTARDGTVRMAWDQVAMMRF